MLRDGKVYVPRDEKLRAEVIQLHHDTLVGEHREQWKITELVTRNFWWPEVTKKVKKYIEGCNVLKGHKRELHTRTNNNIIICGTSSQLCTKGLREDS